MSIEGQGNFISIYFLGFLCFVLYWAKISGERLQDHWSSGFGDVTGNAHISFFGLKMQAVRTKIPEDQWSCKCSLDILA